MTQVPAISLAAVPGRRKRIIEAAQEAEKIGFSGIYCPSLGDSLSLCTSIAMATTTIRMGTSITPIYTRNVADFASVAGFLDEISDGRFRFGIGVSHEPAMTRLGITQGKPLSDIRNFVEAIKQVPRVGNLPPLVLATLRDKMIGLADEIGNGMVFANGARNHMSHSLSLVSEANHADPEFFIGNMIPTCINDDEQAAMAVNRKTLTSYAFLPNYRNYWSAAGFEQEMTDAAAAIADGRPEDVGACLSDAWLSQTTLFGSASKVREGIEAWFDTGLKTPIIVPSAVSGGQFQAISDLFDLFK